MRRISLLAIAAICAIPLMGCLATPQPESTSWRLTQTPLPKREFDSARQMKFAPDGSRIAFVGSETVELFNANSLESLLFFKIEGRPNEWARYLDTGAVAFGTRRGNNPRAELLLPDLTRRPLPAGTDYISSDGRFVATHVENTPDAPHDMIKELASGRMVCDLGSGSDLRQTDMNHLYATTGRRDGFVICELATGKLTWLEDGDGVRHPTGWMDPQGRWLLMVWHRGSVLTHDAYTGTALYRLPLVPERVLTGPQVEGYRIEAKPVKRWTWNESVWASFSPDGQWLMTRSSEKVQLVRIDALDDPVSMQTGKSYVGPFFSRDSGWLAFQDDETVYLADLHAKPRFIRMKPPAPVKSFTLYDIAPDGKALLAEVRTMQDEVERVVWRIEALAK